MLPSDLINLEMIKYFDEKEPDLRFVHDENVDNYRGHH